MYESYIEELMRVAKIHFILQSVGEENLSQQRIKWLFVCIASAVHLYKSSIILS